MSCRKDDNSTNALQEPLLRSDRCNNNNDSETISKSRNINLILTYTFVAFAGRALWCQSVLSTFVYLLRNNNPEAVGFITAVMGLSQLIASFPAGILADQHRRDVALKIAAVVGMAAICLTLLSVYNENYVLLTAALAVWGLLWGIANTSLSALFADSIRDGDRSHYFTQRSILIKLGNTTGPLVALVLFAVLGDHWTLHDCAIVMAVGQIVCLPAVILLCFPSDNYAVVQENYVEEEEEQDILSRALLFREASSDSLDSDLSIDGRDSSPLQSDFGDSLWSEPPARIKVLGCIPEERVIPVLVCLADVISGLGSGMSIRYFPIFFLENLRLSPVMVQILGMLAPLTGTVLAHLAQTWSLSIGRCRMTCVYKWIGISCMVAMILSYKSGLPVWFVCVLYMLRTSFMNSTTALTKSVLMDAVPKNERGKWSALESVNMFSWSGSAALGGILVGLEGILFNFCVTASLQLLATLPLVILFNREEREEGTTTPTALASTTSSSTEAEESSPSRPHFTNDARFKV